jgi:hypothetical protein
MTWQITGEPRDAMLSIVGELAANAVEATIEDIANFPEQFVIPVIVYRLIRYPARIRIELWDRSPREPELQEAGFEAESGRGLTIVDALTGGNWGASPRSDPRAQGDAKCVWAELPLSISPEQTA